MKKDGDISFSPSFQLIDTLFFLFDVLYFMAKLLGLWFFKSGLLFDTLFALFDHLVDGTLFLFVGFVFEVGF